jgi:hypothetical protein
LETNVGICTRHWSSRSKLTQEKPPPLKKSTSKYLISVVLWFQNVTFMYSKFTCFSNFPNFCKFLINFCRCLHLNGLQWKYFYNSALNNTTQYSVLIFSR